MTRYCYYCGQKHKFYDIKSVIDPETAVVVIIFYSKKCESVFSIMKKKVFEQAVLCV